jgi:hypothetical protein
MGDRPGGGRGYGAGVLRRAFALLVAALPPESRERAVVELMRALEDLHAREGVAFGRVEAAPLDLILDELQQKAAETSWRDLGREVGLNPRTLQLMAERRTKSPRKRTEARLRHWHSRSVAPRSTLTVESAGATIDMLTSGLPDEDQRTAVLGILSILHALHTRRGAVAAPAWLLGLMAKAYPKSEP